MKKTYSILFLLAISLGAFAQGVRTKGFAVMKPGFDFQEYRFTRHECSADEIQLEVLYCGICHSDLHEARQDWMEEHYPLVPGHEIVGRVVKVGKGVTRFKPGDYAGVGCIVNSCRTCGSCTHDRQQYCPKMVATYNSVDYYHGDEAQQGGYSDTFLVPEDYAIRIPEGADLKRVAPLLCAGITTYSPIRFAGVKAGDRVGIAGFGGLGHMAVQYAVALGAEVTVFDITEDKRTDALRLGAKMYVNINNADELKGLDGSFDFILSTIPAPYDMSGKVIVPFVTYGARTYLNEAMQKMFKCTPNSVHVPETLPEDIDPDNIREPQDDDDGIEMPGNIQGVDEWLQRMGLLP